MGTAPLEVDLLLRKSKVVREGDPLSLRAQETRGRKWATQNGYQVRKVWRENLSAYTDVRRPQYDAAMAAVLSGDVPCLWVYALDRFSRRGAEAVVPILGKARIVFDFEGLDSLIERDRQYIIQRAEEARAFSYRLSTNVRRTKNQQREEGRWLGRPPYGLVADRDRKLVPMLEPVDGQRYARWNVVQRIYEDIADGHSLRSIAKSLNAEGISAPAGGSWCADSVRVIVLHPAYEGWMTVSPPRGRASHGNPTPYRNSDGARVRCVSPETIPLMISQDLAAKARRAMGGQQAIPLASRNGRPKRILAGLLSCEGCKRAMVSAGRAYACYFHSSGGFCPAPATAAWGALDDYVSMRWLSRVTALEPEDSIVADIAQRWNSLTAPDDTQAIQEATAVVKAAEKDVRRLAEDRAAGLYEGEMGRYFPPLVREAEGRLSAARAALDELSVGPVDITVVLDGILTYEAWDAADNDLRRELLGLAIDRVYVSKAAKRGVPFVGAERCRIQWADSE